MTIPPTPRQLEALRFIAGYQQANHGRSPTFVEIQAGLGMVAGKSGSARLLAGLEERGLIARQHFTVRGQIRLLIDVPVPAAPDGAPLYFVPVP